MITVKVYSFEKLDCWQQARKLAVWVYKITKQYPDEEKFGLISQMRRAAMSIASNMQREHLKKQKKIKQTLVQLHIAVQLNY